MSGTGSSRTHPLETTRKVLRHLTNQVRRRQLPVDGPDAGYTLLIDVIGDVGRSMGQPDVNELRKLLPFVASVREELEEENHEHFGEVARTPSEALRAPKLSTAYAAGALWATSSIVNGFIDGHQRHRAATVGRASRAELRERTRDLLRERECLRPSEARALLRSGEGHDVDPPTISRVFSDLVTEGSAKLVKDPDTSDRRARYYAWSPKQASDTHQARVSLRSALTALCESHDPEAVARLAEEEAELLRTLSPTAPAD